MRALLRVLAGLIGWAVGFSILYGLHGIACARGWSAIGVGPTDRQRLVLVAAWLVSVAAIAIWTRLVWRRSPGAVPLLDWLARGSAVTGLFAMIISGLPIVIADPCPAEVGQPTPGTVAAASGCEESPCQLTAHRAAVSLRKALIVRLPANNADFD